MSTETVIWEAYYPEDGVDAYIFLDENGDYWYYADWCEDTGPQPCGLGPGCGPSAI